MQLIKTKAITYFAMGMLLASCGGEGGGGDHPSTALSKVTGSNLGGAQYSFISGTGAISAKAGTGTAAIAAMASTDGAQSLFRVDDSGNVVHVTFHDSDGKEIVIEETPECIRKLGEKHLLVHFASGANALANVETGAVTDLSNLQFDLDSAATDQAGNLYLLAGSRLIRLDAVSGEQSFLTATTQTVATFLGVTPAGDAIYTVVVDDAATPGSGAGVRVLSAGGTFYAPRETLVAEASAQTMADRSAVTTREDTATLVLNNIVGGGVFAIVSVEYQTSFDIPDQMRRDMLYKISVTQEGDLVLEFAGEIYDGHNTGSIKYYLGSAVGVEDRLFMFYFVPGNVEGGTLVGSYIEVFKKSTYSTLNLVATSPTLVTGSCIRGTDLVDVEGHTFVRVSRERTVGGCNDEMASTKEFVQLLSFAHGDILFTEVIEFATQEFSIRRLSVAVEGTAYYYGLRDLDGAEQYGRRFANGYTNTQSTAFPEEPRYLTRLF